MAVKNHKMDSRLPRLCGDDSGNDRAIEVCAVDTETRAQIGKVKVVCFDFDHTLIDCSSPVKLINLLIRKRILKLRTGLAAAFWGFKYKLGWSVDQEQARAFIFTGLQRISQREADQLMHDLYYASLIHRYRPQVLQLLKDYQSTGHKVYLASATLLPITNCVVNDLHLDGGTGVQMTVVEGSYTKQVARPIPEGEQKAEQIVEQLNTAYGKAGWEMVAAYGDHFSDRFVMELAGNPVCVEPSRRLEKYAREHGWTILEF